MQRGASSGSMIRLGRCVTLPAVSRSCSVPCVCRVSLTSPNDIRLTLGDRASSITERTLPPLSVAGGLLPPVGSGEHIRSIC